MLRTVAEAMGDLRESVVFLGGTVLPHLLMEELARFVRSAKDVDFIIDFSQKEDLLNFEDSLWEKGFQKVRNGAVSSWVFGRIRVDALPGDPEVLTFNNQWCREAMQYSHRIHIGDDLHVNVISAPYYLGVKFSAFERRGFGNFSGSKDIFDILLIFAGHETIETEIEHRTSPTFKAFLREKLNGFRIGSEEFSNIAALGFRTDAVLNGYLPKAIVRIQKVIDLTSEHR
ncbi:MAG TPA: hypothetical protein PKD12_02255 [Nitrospira sp.]|nr:hypothetical protein [Nitrospira sp.]